MGRAVAGQALAKEHVGSTVAVAMDGSEPFGPQTPGTRTSGIQEAIEAVHAAGGGIVHLRKGVYPIQPRGSLQRNGQSAPARDWWDVRW